MDITAKIHRSLNVRFRAARLDYCAYVIDSGFAGTIYQRLASQRFLTACVGDARWTCRRLYGPYRQAQALGALVASYR